MPLRLLCGHECHVWNLEKSSNCYKQQHETYEKITDALFFERHYRTFGDTSANQRMVGGFRRNNGRLYTRGVVYKLASVHDNLHLACTWCHDSPPRQRLSCSLGLCKKVAHLLEHEHGYQKNTSFSSEHCRHFSGFGPCDVGV